jgi:hypothetical protein
VAPFGSFPLAPGELPDGAGTCPVKETLEQVCMGEQAGLRLLGNGKLRVGQDPQVKEEPS